MYKNKKILVSVAFAVLMVASPIASITQADNTGFAPTQAVAAWEKGDFRVERLAFDSDVVGPFTLGDHVFVAEPVDTCRPGSCDRYDLYKLENGMQVFFGNVPADALDANRFALNGNRLVYANLANESANTWNIIEQNLQDGQTRILAKEVFLKGADAVGVMVEGAYLYLNPQLNFSGKSQGYKQATVYQWNPLKKSIGLIGGKRGELRREEMQDVESGVVLTKLVFENGNKELWLINSNDNTMKAVPGTWTAPHEDIVGAHFLSDGSVEYFSAYVRYTYQPTTDKKAVIHNGHLLSWNREASRAIQLTQDRMAWVDADDRLFVSTGDTVQDVGVVPNGRFRLETNRLSYAVLSDSLMAATSSASGRSVNLATGEIADVAFAVTDTSADVAVGLDAADSVWFGNLKTKNTLRLGYGEDPMLSDSRHVYWRGADGIYEATLSPSAFAKREPMQAVRLAGDMQTYLVKGNDRWSIPNDLVFHTYFVNKQSVITVSQQTFDVLVDRGVAPFAAGTKVKLVGDPRMHIVGSDGKLHWVVSQPVAYRVLGEGWNQGILELPMQDMVMYAAGHNITNEAEFAQAL